MGLKYGRHTGLYARFPLDYAADVPVVLVTTNWDLFTIYLLYEMLRFIIEYQTARNNLTFLGNAVLLGR